MSLRIRHSATRTIAALLAAAFAAAAAPAAAQQAPGIMLSGATALEDPLDELNDIAKDPGATGAQKIAAIGDLFALAQKSRDFQDASDAVEMLVGFANDNTAATADAAIDMLTRLANHPRAKLRELVAFGLYKYKPHAGTDARMLAILLRLADDNDAAVRAAAYKTAADLTRHAALAAIAYDIVIGGTRDTAPPAQHAALLVLPVVVQNIPAHRDEAIAILLQNENHPEKDTRTAVRAKLIMVYMMQKSDHDKIVPVLKSMRADSAHSAARMLDSLMLEYDLLRPDIIDMMASIAADKNNSSAATIAANTLLSAAKKNPDLVSHALRAVPTLLNESGDEYETLQSLRQIADKFPQYARAVIDTIAAAAYGNRSENSVYASTIGEIGAADSQAARHALDTLGDLAKNAPLNIRRDVGFGLHRIAVAAPAMRDEILGLYEILVGVPDFAVAEIALQTLQELVFLDSAYADRAAHIMLVNADAADPRIGGLSIVILASILDKSPSTAPALLSYIEGKIDTAHPDHLKTMAPALGRILAVDPQNYYARIVPLLKKTAYHVNPGVRAYGATAIGNVLSDPLCPDTALLPVLRTLTKDNHYNVRSVAETALADYMHQAQFNALQNALPAISNIENQLPAALTDPALAQIILDEASLIINAPDTAIQQRAADAVGSIGATHPALAAQAIAALASMNDAYHPSARLSAVRNIGTIGSTDAAQAETAVKALSAFGNDTDEAVLSRALAAATIIGKRHPAAGDDARDLLMPFTKSKDATLRRTTEHQLKMLPPAP